MTFEPPLHAANPETLAPKRANGAAKCSRLLPLPSGEDGVGQTNRPALPHASPSLLPRSPSDLPAYELKFLVPEALARQLQTWARQHLSVDPHVEAGLDD